MGSKPDAGEESGHQHGEAHTDRGAPAGIETDRHARQPALPGPGPGAGAERSSGTAQVVSAMPGCRTECGTATSLGTATSPNTATSLGTATSPNTATSREVVARQRAGTGRRRVTRRGVEQLAHPGSDLRRRSDPAKHPPDARQPPGRVRRTWSRLWTGRRDVHAVADPVGAAC
jgi:hypothetical protein